MLREWCVKVMEILKILSNHFCDRPITDNNERDELAMKFENSGGKKGE